VDGVKGLLIIVQNRDGLKQIVRKACDTNGIVSIWAHHIEPISSYYMMIMTMIRLKTGLN